MIKMGQSFFPSGNRPKFVFASEKTEELTDLIKS